MRMAPRGGVNIHIWMNNYEVVRVVRGAVPSLPANLKTRTEVMNIGEVYPPSGHRQSLYCDKCKGHLDLIYKNFAEVISGTRVTINGLPYLHCERCNLDALPDNSRAAIIRLWEDAKRQNSPGVKVDRKKPMRNFGRTAVPFKYDSDDYFYLPGLERIHDEGFLTPVFFKKEVLLKYDSSPNYEVKFASRTYGTVYANDFQISFGINQNGNVLMWLGDIAELPESEQYYLLSENIESDHSIGSEFYDGQIECIFTDPSREDRLFGLRSDFVEAFRRRWGAPPAHLDREVLELVSSFNAPIVDTPSERRRVADTLNKVYIESLDNKALSKLVDQLRVTSEGSGNLKRLQAVLSTIVTDTAELRRILKPFFALYDFRVACLHLSSVESGEATLESVLERLDLPESADLASVYERLTDMLAASFEEMAKRLRSPPS